MAQQMAAAAKQEFASTQEAKRAMEKYDGDFAKLKSDFFQIRNKLARTRPQQRTKEDIAHYRELLSYVNNPILIRQDQERQMASVQDFAEQFSSKPATLLDRIPQLRKIIANQKGDYTERIRAKEQLDQIIIASRMVDQNSLREQIIEHQKNQAGQIIKMQRQRNGQIAPKLAEKIAVDPLKPSENEPVARPKIDLSNPANRFHATPEHQRDSLRDPNEVVQEMMAKEEERRRQIISGKKNPVEENIKKFKLEEINAENKRRENSAYYGISDDDRRILFAKKQAEKMENFAGQRHVEEVIAQINLERQQRAANNKIYNPQAKQAELIKTPHELEKEKFGAQFDAAKTRVESQQADVQKRLEELTAQSNAHKERMRNNDYSKMLKEYAAGGIVPGTGSGDTVPALLTPGEMVVPKHQVKKFAAGGMVGGESGSYADIMDAANRFNQAAAQIGQGLSGFSTSVAAFGESVGTFGEFVAQFDEAVSKIPEEITLSGANDISVNIMGQDSIVRAVTEALGPMIAEAIRNSQPVEQRSS